MSNRAEIECQKIVCEKLISSLIFATERLKELQAEARRGTKEDSMKTNWNGKYDTERIGCFQTERGMMFLGYFTQEHQEYGLFVDPDYDGDGSDVWEFFVDFERKHKRSVSRIDRVKPRIQL
jgi:hypothetical protein